MITFPTQGFTNVHRFLPLKNFFVHQVVRNIIDVWGLLLFLPLVHVFLDCVDISLMFFGRYLNHASRSVKQEYEAVDDKNETDSATPLLHDLLI